MTTNDSSQHPNSQWTPRRIKVRLRLSEKSLNSQSRFYSYITAKEGFTIPSACFFTVTSRDGNSFRVKLAVTDKPNSKITEEESTTKKNALSFHVISTLGDISTTCSKLNMAKAFACKIVAKLVKDHVVFIICAPNKSVENSILKNFKVFDDAHASRWEEEPLQMKRFFLL